jgi:histidine ammonia-lyase
MVTISHRHALTLENVAQVALGAHVALDTRTRSLLTMKRRQVAKYVNENFIPTYGFNRGFGYQVDTVVSKERVVELQYSLIRSHACGVGDLLPKEIVRAAMLLRAQSLALLHSGVRAEVIVQIITYLNKDIIPAIPSFGSLGASGDLAPLSHMTMALIGEGMVLDAHGKPTPSATVLRRLKVKPLQLEMKEGLALINGVQVSTAIGVLAARQTRTLLDTALRATAISTQVLLGSERPFAADVHQLRPHPGAIAVAKELTKLMRGSPLGGNASPLYR